MGNDTGGDAGLRCRFCWTEFDAPVALLKHEEAEEASVGLCDIIADALAIAATI